jgi:hypothetical protein
MTLQERPYPKWMYRLRRQRVAASERFRRAQLEALFDRLTSGAWKADEASRNDELDKRLLDALWYLSPPGKEPLFLSSETVTRRAQFADASEINEECRAAVARRPVGLKFPDPEPQKLPQEKRIHVWRALSEGRVLVATDGVGLVCGTGVASLKQDGPGGSWWVVCGERRAPVAADGTVEYVEEGW